jgi:hypothetical protein
VRVLDGGLFAHRGWGRLLSRALGKHLRRLFHGEGAIIIIIVIAAVPARTDAVFVPEPLLDDQRDIFVDRTGVRLLLGDAKLRKEFQNSVRLHFEFAGQLIDSDL